MAKHMNSMYQQGTRLYDNLRLESRRPRDSRKEQSTWTGAYLRFQTSRGSNRKHHLIWLPYRVMQIALLYDLLPVQSKKFRELSEEQDTWKDAYLSCWGPCNAEQRLTLVLVDRDGQPQPDTPAVWRNAFR